MDHRTFHTPLKYAVRIPNFDNHVSKQLLIHKMSCYTHYISNKVYFKCIPIIRNQHVMSNTFLQHSF